MLKCWAVLTGIQPCTESRYAWRAITSWCSRGAASWYCAVQNRHPYALKISACVNNDTWRIEPLNRGRDTEEWWNSWMMEILNCSNKHFAYSSRHAAFYVWHDLNPIYVFHCGTWQMESWYMVIEHLKDLCLSVFLHKRKTIHTCTLYGRKADTHTYTENSKTVRPYKTSWFAMFWFKINE